MQQPEQGWELQHRRGDLHAGLDRLITLRLEGVCHDGRKEEQDGERPSRQPPSRADAGAERAVSRVARTSTMVSATRATSRSSN